MISTKRLLFPALLIAAALTSLVVATLLSRPKSFAQSTGSWVPYQIVYKVYAGTPNATPTLVSDEISAVRSDGATARSSTLYRADGPAGDRLEREIALPGGIRVRTDDTLKIMSTTKDVAGDGELSPSRQRDPSKSCAEFIGGGGQSALGFTVSVGEMFLGYATYEFSNDMGRYRHKILRAPAVGCATMSQHGDKIDTVTGEVIGTSDRTAVSVRLGEPDDGLFKLPVGLKNVSPSELAAAQASACCNKELSASDLALLQQGDDHFRKFRLDF